MDRGLFLSRVREAAAKGRAYPAPVLPDTPRAAAYVGGGADLSESLLRQWMAAGGQGARVTGSSAAQEWLSKFLKEHGVRSVVRWRHAVLERQQVDAVCAAAGVAAAVWPEIPPAANTDPAEPAVAANREAMLAAARESAFDSDLGITSVDFAVAETGSLALASLPGQGRLVSLLPPRYLAIVERSQIVPDLIDVFDRLAANEGELPANFVFVTGPSKTGDIELKLTTGVHGPGAVHLLIVD